MQTFNATLAFLIYPLDKFLLPFPETRVVNLGVQKVYIYIYTHYQKLYMIYAPATDTRITHVAAPTVNNVPWKIIFSSTRVVNARVSMCAARNDGKVLKT